MSAYRQDCHGCREERERADLLSAKLETAERSSAAAARATMLRGLPWSYLVGLLVWSPLYWSSRLAGPPAPPCLVPWLVLGVTTLVAMLGWAVAAYLFSWVCSGAWDRWRRGGVPKDEA